MKRPLRFGVVGLGFGKNYIRILQKMDDVDLVAIASSSKRNHVETLTSSVVKTKVYNKAEQLIADPDIDSVVLASPPSTHLPLIELAVKNRKHILVEKPLVINLEEGKKLKKILQNYNRCFMVGHIYLYNDYVSFLKKYIRENRLGKIYYTYFELCVPGPIRKDVECLWEIGAHHLSILDYLFDSPRLRDVKGGSVDIAGDGKGDFVAAHLTYENKLASTIIASWFSPEKIKRFTIAGAKGIALFDDMASNKKLKIFKQEYPKRIKRYSHRFDLKVLGGPLIPHIQAKDPLKNELEHFIRCIREDTEPLSGMNEGLRIISQLNQISRNVSQ